jgi:hypothetical protein
MMRTRCRLIVFEFDARRALVAGAAVVRRALIAQGFALTWATVDGRGRVRLHAAFPCPQRSAATGRGRFVRGYEGVPRHAMPTSQAESCT